MKAILGKIIMLSITLTFFSGHAQYTGPVKLKDSITQIKYVVQHPEHWANESQNQVNLEGYLLYRTDGNKYLLSDKSGKIYLHIPNPIMPETPFNETDLIRVKGVVIKSENHTPMFIEVSSVVVIKKKM